ncbi:uncharacterized protein LOC131949079 [Physella acuta]|uniref:uncharacterized protein LOC131949079 n=1 Tax=Physella acuta TaxID=109671 RepID=UPI0027DE502A|nr:uncharacterized protein LOC131949079 [Physella acuta]
MSNNVIEEYDDLLMIVAVNTRRTTVVINEETMLFFDKPHRMTVMISSDIPKHIKADNLIVCYYLSKGNDCASSLALAWLVPVELFYFSYAFSVPYPNNSRSTPMRAYLIMVAEKDLYSDILVDDMRALSYNALVSDVPTSTYQIRYLQVSSGWHSAYSTNMDNFGLYLYGWKDSGAFLHAVGFVVKQEVCTIYKEMQPGDLIDNDCDGSVDEDIPGPDTDPMKRNDFKRGKAEDGGWGEWRGFTCVPCYDTFYTLRRSCDNPAPQYEGRKCAGYDTESSQEKCDNCLMTPCPIGKYGPSCENVCRHCAGACHKITGECPVCSNGWTGVRCTTPCPEMTYGHACRHSCLVKCNGRDCIERELGLCPSGNVTGLSAVVYYLLLVLILGSLYGFFMSRSHLEEDPDVVVTVKRVSSKEYTVTEQIVADQ